MVIDSTGKDSDVRQDLGLEKKKKSPRPLAPPYTRTQALSSKTFDIPPLDGSLTLPEIYDWHLTHTPDHPLFEFTDADGQTRIIKYPEFCRALYKTSLLIRECAGDGVDEDLSSEKTKKVIAVVANSGKFESWFV